MKNAKISMHRGRTITIKKKPDSVTYILYGKPVPLFRARHGRKRTWDSQKEQKLVLGIELSRQHDKKPLLVGPVHVEIRFYFPYPQRRKKIIKYYHDQRPDLSNLIKLIEDVATGIIYEDDAQIASLSATKIFDDNPRTEFTISEIKT